MKFFKKYLWILIALAAVLLDQITKLIVVDLISYEDVLTVIPNFFSLTYILNPGAAFGILAGQRWVFMVFTILIIVGAVLALLSGKIKNIWGVISLAMIVGGGIGNMIDRVVVGKVVDFLAFTFWGYDFAVFNVADVFVCCGVFIFAFYIIFTRDFDSSNDKEELNADV